MERLDQRGNEALARENRELKLKIEKLERENRDLRRSLYEVNMRWATLPWNRLLSLKGFFRAPSV
jgi:hypothetical protein